MSHEYRRGQKLTLTRDKNGVKRGDTVEVISIAANGVIIAHHDRCGGTTMRLNPSDVEDD